MKDEKLTDQNGNKARVMTEPFPHYLGSTEEGPDYGVLVEHRDGPSAGSMEFIPIDHLIIYWKVPGKKAGDWGSEHEKAPRD